MSGPSTTTDAPPLARLDLQHLWHPFTPMRQWRQTDPLIIERGQGPYLIDTEGRRYIDGVSSLWCNVHGHRVPAIDQAVRDQLDKIAHTTLLGLASPPSIELAARLCAIAPGGPESSAPSPRPQASSLNKVFYSDAGATALEVAFKMAVGYWHHQGRPQKHKFIGLAGAYHGDTTGSMSVGYSELFHRPFRSMVFPTYWAPVPDACRPFAECRARLGTSPERKRGVFPSEDEILNAALRDHCLSELESLLQQHAHETAAIVIEPIMQGAAGMICQPPGFVKAVADLARKHNVLLIADEVATGFGRTGTMFACDHELDDTFRGPDIMCLAKGLSGGYLPLAATLTTDEIEQAFTGEPADRRTLYHGHTYTGNALACAAALASLDLFESTSLLEHINQSAAMVADRLDALRPCPNVLDIRQRGIMIGIELGKDQTTAEPFDFNQQTGAAVCMAMRDKGLIVRPLGDVVVLMPIPAMPHDILTEMLDIVVQTIQTWPFNKV